jgi:threonine/homoserine/homoserine lactone efflux protein
MIHFMTGEVWLLFCLTEVVLCFIPGPAVLCVLSSALRSGLRAGTIAATGILAGNALYFVLSATGVAAIILASNRIFSALRWIGAAYLVFLGLRMIFTRAAEQSPMPAATSPASASAPVPGRLFARGFIVQAGNPKALVFFVALLPQFINPAASVPLQILVLGVTSLVIEFLVLGSYASVAARARHLGNGRWSTTLERVGGGCLIAAGTRLAWYRGA